MTKFKHDPSIHLISTTDFFYPLVEDPYMQGMISCCNVVSDIYAMGIDRIDNMLMVSIYLNFIIILLITKSICFMFIFYLPIN